MAKDAEGPKSSPPCVCACSRSAKGLRGSKFVPNGKTQVPVSRSINGIDRQTKAIQFKAKCHLAMILAQGTVRTARYLLGFYIADSNVAVVEVEDVIRAGIEGTVKNFGKHPGNRTQGTDGVFCFPQPSTVRGGSPVPVMSETAPVG